MVIFYTNSKSTGDAKKKTSGEIISNIESFGHKVISLEFMEYSELLDMEKARNNEHRISIHNQFIRKAIELSDAAVIEASVYSFKLGQEVQIALDKKVPVLLLSKKIDYSEKVQDPCFYSQTYTASSEINTLLSIFFSDCKK